MTAAQAAVVTVLIFRVLRPSECPTDRFLDLAALAATAWSISEG